MHFDFFQLEHGVGGVYFTGWLGKADDMRSAKIARRHGRIGLRSASKKQGV